MKRLWQGIPLGIWMLVGILGLAAIMLTLAQSDSGARPSIGSAAPSGLRILAQLAREDGRTLLATRDPEPVFQKGDVPVLVLLESSILAEWTASIETPEQTALREHVTRYLEEGGTVIVGSLSEGFRQASVKADAPPVGATNRIGNVKAKVAQPTTEADLSSWRSLGDVTQVWHLENRAPYLDVYRVDEGRLIVVKDWLHATNRFITEHDHAPIFLGALRDLIPADSRLVFLEAAWGNNRTPTLLDRLGPAYSAAWGQVLIVLLVIAYTLGRGFGLPQLVRPRQVGQRDLVEAAAGFFRRANATDVALTAVLADARHKILNHLKLSRGTEWQVWSLRVPDTLRNVYREVEVAAQGRIRSSDAIKIAADLDREVTAFIGAERLASRRKIRSDGTRSSRF